MHENIAGVEKISPGGGLGIWTGGGFNGRWRGDGGGGSATNWNLGTSATVSCLPRGKCILHYRGHPAGKQK